MLLAHLNPICLLRVEARNKLFLSIQLRTPQFELRRAVETGTRVQGAADTIADAVATGVEIKPHLASDSETISI